MAVRRQSQGPSRASRFTGVARQPGGGLWEARLGAPNQELTLLGAFEAEEEAARAYDRALVRLQGSSALTNFPTSVRPLSIEP